MSADCRALSKSFFIRISSNEATDLFKCPRGIRHGCILSPLLHSRVGKRITMRELNFSMVIRNILDIIMYADDVVLLKCCRSKETHHHLIRLFPKEEINTCRQKPKYVSLVGIEVLMYNNHILESAV
jgi:hypothetical protein